MSKPDAPSPRLSHISVVADTLGLSIRQVRALCEDGRLPSVEIARKTYIPAEAVENFVTGIGGGAA